MRNILIVLTFVCCNVLIAGTALATPIHTDQHNYGRLSYAGAQRQLHCSN